MKVDLKSWNYSVFGSLDEKISNLRDEIQEADLMDDVFELEEEEYIRRNVAQAELLRNLNLKQSLCAQKARIKWLKEGDINSSFFHKAINQRRKSNELVGLQINGQWVEDVAAVKRGFFLAL